VQLCVLILDDREDEDSQFLLWSRLINERYCAEQSIELHFVTGPMVPELADMPPHWARVARLESLVKSGKMGDDCFAIVMDSDAAFTNPSFPLAQLLAGMPADRSIFVAKDPAMYPPPPDCSDPGVFCAGFVCIRLSIEGLCFLKAWRNSFDPSHWSRDNKGRWHTAARWAGPAYEQGQLNRLVRGDFQHATFELPQSLFNSPYARAPGRVQPPVLHLMRLPGEPSGAHKDSRVEETLRSLWQERIALEVHKAPDGCTNSCNAGTPALASSGIPMTAIELAAWEALEEAKGP